MQTQIQTNWYQELLSDLKKIAWSRFVELKHGIGKRILKDEAKFGKSEYGSKRIENIAKDLKIGASDVWACVRFAKKFPELSDSIRELSWFDITHNYLPETKQDERKLLSSPSLPKGKYNIIYADPPWTFYAGGYKNQSQHYDTMSIEDICNLPVKELADENCILFLWATYPILDRAFEVIKAWGFEYSTVGFTWVKSNKGKKGFFFGLGMWTRSNAEVCLIATKGSIKRKDASISQIIYSPIEKHSKKPEEVKEKIERLVGKLPRIELFARQKTEGWDVWGNQV